MTEEQRADVKRLEAFVAEKSEAGQLLLGWVTGSSLDSVTSKMEKGGFHQFPHFIASNLGTEIVYTSDAHFGQPDTEWMKRLDAQGFSDEKSKTSWKPSEKRAFPLDRKRSWAVQGIRRISIIRSRMNGQIFIIYHLSKHWLKSEAWQSTSTNATRLLEILRIAMMSIFTSRNREG